MSVALCEQPERIDETGVHEVLKSRALLVGEPLLAAIGLGVGQIELGVRDIEVATENDRLRAFQLPAVREKCRIPVFEAKRQAAQVVLGIRCVDRHHEELCEFRRDDAAFLAAVALAARRRTRSVSRSPRGSRSRRQQAFLRKIAVPE